MLNNLNIGQKLALLLVGFSLIVIVFLSSSYYIQFESALRERVFLQLSSVKQLKKVKILAELQDHLDDFERILNDSIPNPSNDFIETMRTPSAPDSLLEYAIPKKILGETPVLIDLTNQQPEKGITLAFQAKYNNEYVTSLVRLPEVQDILLERTGLGETGESYIVNAAYQLITKSRFEAVNWQNTTVKTQGVIQAFDGNPGTDVFNDYRGIRVLGAFEKISFLELEWVLLSEINFDEALAPLAELRSNLFFIFLLIVVFILIVSYYLSRLIVKPILTMESQLIKLSEGVLDTSIPRYEERDNDEIGHMFNALDRLIKALNDTVVFAGEIGSGNFNAEFEPLSVDDKLGKALVEMKNQLQEYQQKEDVFMRQNQQSILDGQEKERSRLSKELHDGMGPMLTIMRMNIESAKVDKGVKQELLNHIDHAISEVRRMSNNLMPSVLEDFGVGEAIQNLIDQINESSNEVNIRYKKDILGESKLQKTSQIMVYRVVQEALNNALRHSECTEIKISLTEFDEYMSLLIADNGKGFDPNQNFKGNGLRNMKERIKLIPGSIDISSTGSGTRIEIEIPYQ